MMGYLVTVPPYTCLYTFYKFISSINSWSLAQFSRTITSGTRYIK